VCVLGARLDAALLQSAPQAGEARVTVTDQNGRPLAGVRIVLFREEQPIATTRTGITGVATLEAPAGSYKAVIEQQGYYSAQVTSMAIVAGEVLPLEIQLQPVREFTENVEVKAQPSPIDPEQTSGSESLSAQEVSLIPYPTTRDYRNVFPYMPGVIADSTGQIHVAGSSTQEIQDYLDGFEVSQPAGGNLALRLNPDSLHRIDVRDTRYSAQFGKGSGGFTDLELQDGDNNLRFNATDFVPTFQNVKGFHLNNWTPRAYVSGPLVRGKIWFDVSNEDEKDLNIVRQLPDGQDTNPMWRSDNVARLRMNLAPGNVLTASVLLNLFHSNHSGISPLDPYSVAFNQNATLYLASLKDQLTIGSNTLLEFGAGFHRTLTSLFPFGASDYVMAPSGREGNFYMASRSQSDRTQGFVNLFFAPRKRMGSHQFSLGGRMDRVLFHDVVLRDPVQFVDQNNTLLRQITFTNLPAFTLSTVESSAWLQDRWSVLQRLVLEAGGRWDHDSFIQRDFFSPRIAASLMLSQASETKLTAGAGLYYDRTNLALASQSFQGARTDDFFSPVSLVIPASFVVDPRLLSMPRFTNWSAGVERRIARNTYFKLGFLSRHGVHGWAYEAQPDGTFLLGAHKQDRYDAGQITVRTELKHGYPLLVGYTRSKTRSNEALDFSLDNFTTGSQLPGPLPWDSPNQLVAWGSYPVPSWWKLRNLDFSFSAIWRSGFPFATVDQFGRLVTAPGSFRFPDYLTVNPGIEKKFVFRHYLWSARIAVENASGSVNPAVVDNNINSPAFLQFFGTGHRTLNGRIRFLGKP